MSCQDIDSSKKYGLLTPIDRAPNNPKRKYQHYWNCKCDCGNPTVVRAANLVTGVTKSCGCLHRLRGSKHKDWKGHGEIYKDFFTTIVRGANARKLPIDITIEQIWDLFLKQDRCCALTGLLLKFGETSKDRSITASLDRIDSNKGYTIDNVQWVHKVINMMKNNLSCDDFINYCSLVSKYKSNEN